MRLAYRLGILAWAAGALPAGAHTFPVSDIDHVSEIRIDRDSITIAYGISISELEALRGIFDMNRGRDYAISNTECYEYFSSLSYDIARGVRFFWDGRLLQVENPRRFELRKPYGMTYHYVAHLDSVTSGLHQFLFLDTNDQHTPGKDTIRVAAGPGVQLRRAQTERRRAQAWVAVGDVPDTGLPAEVPKQVWNENGNVATTASTTDKVTTDTAAAKDNLMPWFSGAGANQGNTYQRVKGKIEAALQGKLSWFIVLTTLFLAFIVGALHALQPGHGKTLVAAYLVGSKGTIWHAVLLGAIVTFTHTFSVFILGLAALYLSAYVLPDTLNFWLSMVSGAVVWGMGMWLFLRGYRRWVLHREGKIDIMDHGHTHMFGGGHGHAHGGHDHDHPHHHEQDHHDHDHDQGHDAEPDLGQEYSVISKASGAAHFRFGPGRQPHEHEPESSHAHALEHGHSHVPKRKEEVTLWSLFTLGVVGGLAPCVDAIVLLLIAVALHRIALGLLIILVFSLGIATVLVSVGILMVKAKGLVDRLDRGRNMLAWLPMVSAGIVTVIGITMIIKSLTAIGWIRFGS